MSDNKTDLELAAMATTWAALESLEPDAQQRVIEYILSRLNLDIGQKPAAPPPVMSRESVLLTPAPALTSASPHITDVRSFAEIKAPKTAIERAAVIAYYLQYEAPEAERQNSVSVETLKKYFHLARFPAPGDYKSTLTNARQAGYLDPKERGQYALNAVGYNLVAHRLKSGAVADAARKPRLAKKKNR